GQVGGDVPAGQLGAEHRFQAADACGFDVVRAQYGAVAGPDDQVVDLVLEGIQAPVTPGMIAGQAQLVALRFFRLHVRVAGRVAAGRVVQIVEGRRAEGRAPG